MVGRTSILQRTVSFAFFVVSMKRGGGGSNVVWLGELRAIASVGWAFRHFFGLHFGARVESRHFFGLHSHFFGLHSGAQVESRHFFGLHSGAQVESRHFFGLYSGARVESRHFFGLTPLLSSGSLKHNLFAGNVERQASSWQHWDVSSGGAEYLEISLLRVTYSDFMSPTRGPRKVIQLLRS